MTNNTSKSSSIKYLLYKHCRSLSRVYFITHYDITQQGLSSVFGNNGLVIAAGPFAPSEAENPDKIASEVAAGFICQQHIEK